METKKKPNYFKIVIITLFIIYISLYILNYSGYYDGNIRKRTELTSAQIKKFEEDVQNGEYVDLNDYLKDQNKNYTNKTSKIGYIISSNTEIFLNEGIKEIIKVLGKLFT